MNAVPKGFPFVTFDNAPLWQSQKIFLGANLLGYLITLVKPHAHYHVDLLGTGAFAAAALPALLSHQLVSTRIPGTASTLVYSTKNPRIQWSASAVTAWSVKLALFLLYRVVQSKDGKDNRLDEILSSPTRAAGFWLFSLAWGSICSLPHVLGTTSSSVGHPVALRLGSAMAAIGWLTETLADYQKHTWKQTNPNEPIRHGLWSLSQHPNWLGNLLLWTGVLVMNAPALVEPVLFPNRATWLTRVWSYRRVGLAACSPLFMLYLFWSQATGRLLPEGLAATKKRYGYGVDQSYTQYVDTTPLIFPSIVHWWSRRADEATRNSKSQ